MRFFMPPLSTQLHRDFSGLYYGVSVLDTNAHTHKRKLFSNKNNGRDPSSSEKIHTSPTHAVTNMETINPPTKNELYRSPLEV